MSAERGPLKHPPIGSMSYPDAHPSRVCVMRTGHGTWAAVQGYCDLATYPTHAEAFADAWARTHPKASLVPLGNDTYRVVGAMRRSAVTGRYLTSADKGE